MAIAQFFQNVKSKPVTLPTSVTIDSGPDPGRFLPTARASLRDARLHGSLAEALTFVAGEAEATIVGHGIDAFLAAGTGAKLRHVDSRHLCLDHAAEWGRTIDALGTTKIQRLTIFGCSVGAGQRGAELVFALAKKLDAHVRAPLGDVWIDETRRVPVMTKDGGWQEAHPRMCAPPAPAAIPVLAPVEHSAALPYSSNLLLFDRDRFMPLPFTAVESIAWRSSDDEDPVPERSWSGIAARVASAAIGFNKPLIFSGPLASLITGELTVTVRFLRDIDVRQFFVYNNRLIEDRRTGVHYRIDIDALMNAGR